MMIAVTGATGKLGVLVIQDLLRKLPANRIIALVRDHAKAGALRSAGVIVREADYDKPETLRSALSGVEKVLLISSNDIGRRLAQHAAVIRAAQESGVNLIAYTSVLQADRSGLSLALEHKATEEAIRHSKIPYVMLRNGWYLENHTEHLVPALDHGAIFGSAGEGRFASASRADYAAAAAAVLTESGHENRTYELAGSHPFTLRELALEVSKQSGKPVKYLNLPPAEFEKVLITNGLPAAFASAIADSDLGAAKGDLDGSSNDLRVLIGRESTTLADAIRTALAKIN
jgi:NAD(P)H dehydrogenase (quinone)